MGIFDEFVQGVNRELTRVQSRSQEMIQTYNINSQVRTLEGRKTASMIEIGRMVFEKYEKGTDVTEEALQAKVKEIVDLEHEITILMADLEALRAQSDPNMSASQKAEFKAGYTPTPGFTCPHCQAPANMDKTFCPACGGTLREESKEQSGKEGNGSGD